MCKLLIQRKRTSDFFEDIIAIALPPATKVKSVMATKTKRTRVSAANYREGVLIIILQCIKSPNIDQHCIRSYIAET